MLDLNRVARSHSPSAGGVPHGVPGGEGGTVGVRISLLGLRVLYAVVVVAQKLRGRSRSAAAVNGELVPRFLS
jgi:hypothetical protein